MSEAEPTSAANEEPSSLASLIGRLAGRLSNPRNRGEVSELRRSSPESPPAAFFQLAAQELADPLSGSEASRLDRETRWAALIHCFAHAPGSHRQGAHLGRALAQAGVSEMRFRRLLRAEDDALFDQARRVVHQLAQKGEPFDWLDLATLFLATDDGPKEGVRRRLARRFYAATSVAEKESA